MLQSLPMTRRATKVSGPGLGKVETWHVTELVDAWHPAGNRLNVVRSPNERTIPGSGDNSRRSTVTFQDAVNVSASKIRSDNVMSGQLTSRYLRMRLDVDDGTVVSSTFALTDRRIRFVLQMNSIEDASSIVSEPLASTTQAQPCSVTVHSSELSWILVPILVSADTAIVPSATPRFSSSTSQ